MKTVQITRKEKFRESDTQCNPGFRNVENDQFSHIKDF